MSHLRSVVLASKLGPLARNLKRQLTMWRHGGVYRREKQAVTAGLAEYRRSLGSGRDLYLLRRNVHMLEKGLTMQPRRDTFARGYIRDTVASFEIALSDVGALSIETAETRWMAAVLDEYFEATLTSKSGEIAREAQALLRDETRIAVNDIEGHGPHPPALGTRVDIDDLLALAEGRRSVRWFSDQPVPRERAVDRAIATGAEAPTACNRQPYRFEIFDDPESVARVAAVPMGAKGYEHQIKGIVVMSSSDLSAYFDRRDRHLIYVDGSSRRRPWGSYSVFGGEDVASCSINWPDIPERERTMRNLLELDAWERPIMLLAYGYPSVHGLTPYFGKKRPRSHTDLSNA